MSKLMEIGRAQLVDGSGLSYGAFRQRLVPRWTRVWLDLGLGYFALVATSLVVAQALSAARDWWPLIVLGCAVSFGYWMAYLQLFIHEAAHFNLLPDRHWNDRVANALIASWVGADIASYRAVHWTHHRRHGEPDDTEHSYFSALGGRFIFEALTGMAALRVLLFRRKHLDRTVGADASKVAADASPAPRLAMTTLAGALHAGVIGSLYATASWPLALSWLVGMAMFFPFFGALRQLLEHRSQDARASVDYSVVAHGATTRMFREGLFASTFGAAGFTRHELHHWDPGVSYTNLRQVEEFLCGCPAVGDLSAGKTTYWRAFRALYGR